MVNKSLPPDGRNGMLVEFMRSSMIANMNELLSRVVFTREVCDGRAAIGHSWYPMEFILEYPAAPATFEDLPAGFPDLESGNLRACLESAAYFHWI